MQEKKLFTFGMYFPESNFVMLNNQIIHERKIILKKNLITVFLVSLLYVADCSEDTTETIVTNPEGTLNLTLNGLEDLGCTPVYEGWIMVGGSP